MRMDICARHDGVTGPSFKDEKGSLKLSVGRLWRPKLEASYGCKGQFEVYAEAIIQCGVNREQIAGLGGVRPSSIFSANCMLQLDASSDCWRTLTMMPSLVWKMSCRTRSKRKRGPENGSQRRNILCVGWRARKGAQPQEGGQH